MKHYLILSLLFSLITLHICAQETQHKTLDSLENLYIKNINNSPTPTTINRIKHFVKTVEDLNIKDSIYLKKKAEALSRLIIMYAREQKYDSARYYYNKVVNNYTDKSIRIYAHQKIALVEYNDLNHDKALYYYYKAIEEAESIGAIEEKLKVLIDLSIFYRYAEDFESAQLVLDVLLANFNDSLSNVFKFKIKYEDVNLKFSQKQYRKALQTLRSIDTTGFYKNSIYFRVYHEAYVEAFTNLKQYDSALYYNDIAVHHPHSTASYSPIDDYTYYANIYHKKGEFKKALSYLEAIKDTSAVSNSNYSLKDFHELSYKIHKALGNIALAFNNYEKYHAIQSKIDKETKEKQAAIMKYRLQKDRTINALKLSQVKAEKKQQQNFYTSLSGFIGILIILGFLFLVFKQKQRRRQIVIDQKIELDKFKNQYIENISHEIRTPLTLIKGITHGIKKNKGKCSPQNIFQLEQNVSTLLNITRQILDLRQLDSEELKLELEQADVVSYIKVIVDSFQYLAYQKNIDLTLETNAESQIMDFDKEKLKYIMSNLISNAIKFTPKNGNIKILISKVKNEGNCLEICVEDNGVGISENDQKNVFDRFYKTDTQNKDQTTGFGIGLHFTRELVNLISGDITIESQEGKGTSVRVQLPISTTEVSKEEVQTEGTTPVVFPEETDTTELVSTANNPSTILIVEDNPDVQSLLLEQLSDYSTIVADDGEEGLIFAKEKAPDLIISDIMMPKKDGYELCKAIKSDVVTSHIPVVLLTAKADQQSKIEGLTQKADAYIYKPYDVEELLLVVKNLIESRKALQNIYKNSITANTSTAHPIEDQFIAKFKSIILKNISDDNYTIDNLCVELKLSRASLHNKLKALTGLSTSNYINRIRMHKAKELLEDCTINVTEVSYQVGMTSLAYFSTLFKKEFGMSPRQYQEGLSQKID